MTVSGIRVTCSVNLSWVSKKSSPCKCRRALARKKYLTSWYSKGKNIRRKTKIAKIQRESADRGTVEAIRSVMESWLERQHVVISYSLAQGTKKEYIKVQQKGDPFESVLHHAGSMGRFQKMLVLGLLPFGLFFAFVYFTQLFITSTPQKYWCRVPELEHLDVEQRRNLTAPGAAGGGDWDKCATYNVNWSSVLESKQNLTTPDSGTETIPCPNGWEFEHTNFKYDTVATEKGWVCERANYGPISHAIFFAGAIVGGLLFASIGDRLGRLPGLMGANLAGCLGGIGTIFTRGIWDFTICRFLVGMSFDNIFMMMYILVLEYVGTSHRTCVTNLSIALFFGAGCLLLPALSLWLNDWRMLLWVTSLPMLLVVFVPCFLKDSPSWQATRGRIRQAVNGLRNVARVNKKKIPNDVMDDFVKSSKETNKKKPPTLCSLMRNRCLRNAMLVLMLLYLAVAVVFDGLVRLSDTFGINFFLMFTLASLTEIPSALLLTFLLDRWGRRKLTCVPMGVAGVLILGCIFIPKGIPVAALALLARFFINMSYNAVIQWVTELLPTAVRASGSTVLRTGGFLATMMSPLMNAFDNAWYKLTLMIMGIMAMVCSAVGLVLPETTGKPMPQSMADGEKIIREQAFLCRFDYRSPDDEESTPNKKAPIRKPPVHTDKFAQANKATVQTERAIEQKEKSNTLRSKSPAPAKREEPQTEFYVETEKVHLSEIIKFKNRLKNSKKSRGTVMIIVRQ